MYVIVIILKTFLQPTSSVITSFPSFSLNRTASFAHWITCSGEDADTEKTGEPYGSAQSPGLGADLETAPDAVNATLLSQQK